MRLLLTSGGLTNHSLQNAFAKLLAKPCEESRVAFIPTAANIYPDQSWVQNDLKNLRETGVSHVDMVDLAKLSWKESVARCAEADVIWMNGGCTYYLLDWVRRSGLAAALPNLLLTRPYVGVSAGSMIAGPTIETNSPIFPEEDEGKLDDLTGLNLVPFAVIPHLFSASFSRASPPHVAEFAKTVRYPIYALDDASAVEVCDGSAPRLVSEGETRVYNSD